MSLNNPKFESQESTDESALNKTGSALAQADVKTEVQAEAKTEVQADAKTEVQAEAKTEAQAEVKEVADAEVKLSTVTGQTAVQGAVALATGRGLASPVANAGDMLSGSNILMGLTDKLRVNWEDFQTINANLGQFQMKSEDGMQIGAEIELHLVSVQEQWVSTPGDMDAEGEGLVLYSDDGINAAADAQEVEDHVEWLKGRGVEDRDRLTLKEHQEYLKSMNHKKAHVQHKVILVGKLIKANDAATEHIGDLVQVHLPDTGRRKFNSHAKQAAFHLIEGVVTPDDVKFIKLTAKTAGTPKLQYTQVNVGYAEGHGKKLTA